MSLHTERLTAILEEYQEKQSSARERKESRTREVYDALPRVREIYQLLESAGLRAVQSIMKGLPETEVFSSLKAENASLQAEKEALLARAGYPKDYLENVYECPICSDTGYTNGERCVCLTKRLRLLAYEESGLSSLLSEQNFDTFSFNHFSRREGPDGRPSPLEQIKQIVKLLQIYVQRFPENEPKHLFFHGQTGSGKTFLSSCLAKALLDRDFSVKYYTAAELCNELDSRRFQRGSDHLGSVNDFLEELDRYVFLIVDDLGTEFSNSVTVSDLYALIDRRLRLSLPLLLVTNLTLSQLEQNYSTRTYSRIKGFFEVLEFPGVDIREKIKKDRLRNRK